MQVIFLGTNGWYDTAAGNTICILIKAQNYHILFDAGNGIYKVDDYCKEKKPAYLFLSHFHLDHIIGLHILNKIQCFQKLQIFGPEGTRNILTTIINQPFTMPLNQLPYGVELFELPEDRSVLSFYVETKPLMHSSLTLGYRIEIDGKVIAYCPDTAYCKNAVELSRNADLLIAECAYKSGQSSKDWPHLTPETAARIAKEANVKQLALVHFDAGLYESLNDRKEAEYAAQNIFSNSISTADGFKIEM